MMLISLFSEFRCTSGYENCPFPDKLRSNIIHDPFSQLGCTDSFRKLALENLRIIQVFDINENGLEYGFELTAISHYAIAC